MTVKIKKADRRETFLREVWERLNQFHMEGTGCDPLDKAVLDEVGEWNGCVWVMGECDWVKFPIRPIIQEQPTGPRPITNYQFEIQNGL